jgi:hypothetical protein
MNDARSSAKNAQARIGKQIRLPWSKAFEIAMKSIRVRFWRSMITMSSIILAIAFLMSIWTSTAITSALATRPQRDIAAVKLRLREAEAALKGGPDAPRKEDLDRRYADDLRAARRRKRRDIAEKEDALKSAGTDERKKLDAEIQKLKGELEPAKQTELLIEYLKAEKRRLDDTKGEIDRILQQERAASDLDAIKEKLAIVEDALRGGQATTPNSELERRYARDIAAARTLVENAISRRQQALPRTPAGEKHKLETELGTLRAYLARARELELLCDSLRVELAELEPTESAPTPIVTLLQLDRAGAEPSGGFATDFLHRMTPTDKWLAVLALLVCFVGIINAMFMTVQERFREIGTMKCLGALDAFIVKIFLIESAVLGFVGTLFGIVVGLLLSALRQLVVYGIPTLTYFPGLNILIAAFLSAVVGLVLSTLAAIFPAQKAARMQPVEAMRIEE